MNITYDRIADAIYVAVGPGQVAKTVSLNDNVNVDVDKNGKLVGLELLNASSEAELLASLEHSVPTGIPISITTQTPEAVGR